MGQTAFELNRGLWREIRPRIGARTVVGIPVRWRAPAIERGRGGHGWRRQAAAPPAATAHPAVLHDLSVTGARLLVPADDAIAPQRTIEIELDGEWAASEVVWVEASEHESARWCGVSIRQPSAAFLANASRITGSRSTGRPDGPLSWEQGGSGDRSA